MTIKSCLCLVFGSTILRNSGQEYFCYVIPTLELRLLHKIFCLCISDMQFLQKTKQIIPNMSIFGICVEPTQAYG